MLIMSSLRQIDQIDRKILSLLAGNARMPYLEIARECGLSGAAIHQRIKKLEIAGIITGSRLIVRPQTLGLNVCAFISIVVSEKDKLWEVLDAIRQVPEVVECHFVTGNASLLLKLYCHDNDHLMQIITTTLQKIPYIQSTDTVISLNQVFERQVSVHGYDPAYDSVNGGEPRQ